MTSNRLEVRQRRSNDFRSNGAQEAMAYKIT